MPQPFKNAVITNDGARLLTRAQAGEIKIEFTRMAVGNGDYTPSEKILAPLQKMRGLRSLKNSFPLSSIEVYSDHSVKISALITNQDPVTGQTLIDAGYFINEMGLFAREKGGEDSTEVLYSIAVTTGENGDFMPPYNGYNPVHIIQDYYATVDNSAEVTIQAGTGAVVLIDDFLKLKALLNIDDIEPAFRYVFNQSVEKIAMTQEEIQRSINTGWNGETSTNPYALTSEEIQKAIDTEWNGETSANPFAITASQISDIAKK